MVYTNPPGAVRAGDMFEAARVAEGRPGLFVARLAGEAFGTGPGGLSLARETAPAYEPATEPARPPARGRIAGVLVRAEPRARALAARGRHAEAIRILDRAVRVLAARGDRSRAARCALLLGSLLHDRGRIEAAADLFERARELEPGSRVSLEATVALGAAWIDDGRFVEAEAALRTALVGIGGLRDRTLDDEVSGWLADCLRLQGRHEEAAALPALQRVHQDADAPIPLRAAAARVWLALGEWPAAARAARQAVEAAGSGADPRQIVLAHHAMAAVMGASGDRELASRHVTEALAAARGAHLTIHALRLRLLRAQLAGRHGFASRRSLTPSMRRALPGLLRRELEGAAGVPDPLPAAAAVADLERLLEVAHAAPDDRVAMERVAAEVATRLRTSSLAVVAAAGDTRALAVHGRPWDGSPIVDRAIATGIGAASTPGHEPFEAAEPLRFGGELIGAIAARWLPGATLDRDRASSILRVGALALATSVRATLDRRVALPSGQATADLVGDSAAAAALREAIVRAARAPFAVLIEGESGSGKELVARAIHRLSARRDRRFCPVNCAAIADDLLEAELFGHVRGAFTGAVGERPGLFEEADGGTLFLDEIGELSARAQAKLLRVLQDGEVRRIGENMPRRVDVRIVAATNRRLTEEVAAGRFRADLRFRLDVVRIDVPPLRERTADVAMLATHFWNDAAARVGSRATLSPEALAALARYDWPGNVRELQNVIAWMAVHSPRRGRLGASGVPAHIAQASPPAGTTFEAARLEFERRFVRAAMATANGQRTTAAATLGVSRQGLAKMLRRLGLDTGVQNQE
jgi:DNA-binding NtrC family response regulator/tetratricopeptide (TPR) repeat protein